MKKVVILGSAGSIGISALRVIESLPDRFRVTGLAVQSNHARLVQQARKSGAGLVAVADPAHARACAASAPDLRVLGGADGVARLALEAEADIVICAVVGIAGLQPVLAAAEAGISVALATKEVLVAAGGHVTAACAKSGAGLLPVDSEHSAIFQCLGMGSERPPWKPGALGHVRRLILTASGGPFGDRPDLDLSGVSAVEALAHPRWKMGKKVTVDSATLMNKGLEIMEAHWLFGMPLDSIDVVVHPESIVHSMVEFADGSVLAQMSVPDMRFAIQYALTFPERPDGGLPPLRPEELGALHFRAPDAARFPCLSLARAAARRGGTWPAALNAANEVAVQAFLDGKLGFTGIWEVVSDVLEKHDGSRTPALDEIVAADASARTAAREVIARKGGGG